ncbi:MAG: hypothetical protein H3C45_05840 [Bacteroidia bacterium]|nr:hypothetical protein [Bacteroidia bacterium]MCC7534070.1 hypothetical protein [Bacteroidia bacterium]
MINKVKLVIILSFLLILNVKAQNIEFGIYGGVSNYIGDVSEQSMRMNQFHPGAAILGRYNLSPKVTFKGMAAYGRISGYDSLASNVKNRVRNTNFYSDLYEFSAHFEYNLVRYPLGRSTERPFVPYLFGGIGIFHFNPKTEFNGNTYELQPLGTEGQGTTQYNDQKKYDLTTVCLPFGAGVKKKISRSFVVGIEAGFRLTFTNYLDDIGGKYANTNVVGRAYGTVAEKLANRTGEVASKYPEVGVAKEGTMRTTRSFLFDSDMYFFAGISFSYVIQNLGIACPNILSGNKR